MLRTYDVTFLKRFSMVIGILAGITILLILLAHFLQGKVKTGADSVAEQAVSARIEPVGAVYAGATGAAAMAAAAEAARKAAASQVAYGGTTDGTVIYDSLCGTCHKTGAGGAPMLTDTAAWAPRIAQGIDTLVKHAIEGYQGKAGLMPARGGNPALTDEQVQATVKWMIDQVR